MKQLLYICLLLIAVAASANNVEVTESFVCVPNTSIAIEKIQWYNDYSERGRGVDMPYALLKVKIKKGAISAKKMFSLDLGSFIEKDKDLEHDNEIWFLIPYRSVNIMLKCGDGCEPVSIYTGRLKPNAVYEGEVSFDDSDYHADENGSVRWNVNKGILRKGSILIYSENGDSLYNDNFDLSKLAYLRYQVGMVYSYEIHCPQYKTIKDTFSVAYKNQIRDIKIDSLKPNYNYLYIKSSVPKLSYKIDNETIAHEVNNVGNAIEGGLHTLHFTAPNYISKDTVIIFSGDANVVNVAVQLKKESALLSIKTSPSKARVEIDGVFFGETPYSHNITIGQHKIHVSKSGYADVDTIVNVNSNKVTQLQFSLNANIYVSFQSSPTDARVTVDGTYIGKTPRTVSLPIGLHEVTMSSIWYKSKTKTMYIDKSNHNVFLKLKRILNRPNEFYMEAGARYGQSSWAVGPTIGGYVYGVNIESSVLFGWQKSLPIYWFNTEGNSITTTYHPTVYSINKFGYGIRVGTRVRITPQIGFGYVRLNEHRNNGILQPMADGSNAWFGVAAMRLSIPVAKHFAFSLTPEYYFLPKLSPGYEVINLVDSTIKNYCTGFNGKLSFVVFF